MLIILILFLCSCKKGAGESWTETDQKQLEDEIFRNYDVSKRPVINLDNTTIVNTFIVYDRVILLEDIKRIRATVYILFSWRDEFIHWNRSNFKNISKIYVDSKKLWFPSVRIINSEDGKLVNSQNTMSKTLISLNDDMKTSNITFEIVTTIMLFGTFDNHGFPNNLLECVTYLKSMDKTVKLSPFEESQKILESYSKRHDRKNMFDTYDIIRYEEGYIEEIDEFFSGFWYRRRVYYFNAIFLVPTMTCALLNVLSFLPKSLVVSCLLSASTILIQTIFLGTMMKRMPSFDYGTPAFIEIFAFIYFANFMSLCVHSLFIRAPKYPNLDRRLSGYVDLHTILPKTSWMVLKEKVTWLGFSRMACAVTLALLYTFLFFPYL